MDDFDIYGYITPLEYDQSPHEPLDDFDFKIRCDWPFKHMDIGQTVRFEHPDYASKAQGAAHTPGQKNGKKFQTRRDGLHIVVKRTA